MNDNELEQNQIRFMDELQTARSEALNRLIELSKTATPDHARVKALETLLRFASNYDPCKFV